MFCLEKLPGLKEKLEHMKIEHGFFIREVDCVVDMKGLLSSLNSIITHNLGCLYCFMEFKSAEAARQHMIDKGHCFMPSEEYRSLSKHYDFTEKLTKLIDDKI